MLLQERCGLPKMDNSEKEKVKLVYFDNGEVDELKFWCIPCAKSFAKVSCVYHMCKTHDLAAKDVLTWCTAKDAGVLKHNRPNWQDRLVLTRALLSGEAGGGAQEHKGAIEDEGEVAQEGHKSPTHEDDLAEEPGEEKDMSGSEATGSGMVMAGSTRKDANGDMWQLLWVKLDHNGQPQSPMQTTSSLPVFMPPRPKAVPPAPALAVVATATTPSPASASTDAWVASALSPFMKSMENIAATIKDATTKKESLSGRKRPKGALEVEGPKARISQEALAWQLPPGFKQEPGKRMPWPLQLNDDICLKSFETFLINVKIMEKAFDHVQHWQ